MEVLTDDFIAFIAIDTNVFGHITNMEQNSDYHINKMLQTLFFKVGACLLVDDRGFIVNEYNRHILKEEQSLTEDERSILRIWMDPQYHATVSVDESSRLWIDICSIVPEEPEPGRENVDRTLVHVAFVENRLLISNDWGDIINKRGALKSKARELGRLRADIMTSKEASARLKKH